ncbi:MAG TPA: hypothetical protein VEA80_10165 [Vitreimonas sp.]|uniref:hypothetical protein n=1 Tax=Vitreimonas sp. TaxID=3069702 RepID=UPI002D506081|nr:hypothetical protein [Vitreimonas sp.]HYD87829.1 hypothetical protein [Vitreimonas sp.]
MKRPILSAFISGVRGMLSAQLFISVIAIALAAWTLTVTNGLIRERDRLRERVIQLETSMAERGVVAPPAPAVVDAPVAGETLYPGSIGELAAIGAASAEVPVDTRAEAPGRPPSGSRLNIGQVLGDLFAPPPPMRLVVLHVRDGADIAAAQQVGAQLREAANVAVAVDVMTPRDPRQSGYIYFDGRQNSATAELVAEFHDIARRASIAPWSAQLRGVALPAEGEYAADRLDIVLPPLPPPPPPDLPPAAVPPVSAAAPG